MSRKTDRRKPRAERVALPAAINLVDWLKLRKRISTGLAKRVILLGCLRLDGEPVGYVTDVMGVKRLVPFIPADRRDDLEIVMPEVLQ